MSFQDGITVITAEWLNGVDSDLSSQDSRITANTGNISTNTDDIASLDAGSGPYIRNDIDDLTTGIITLSSTTNTKVKLVPNGSSFTSIAFRDSGDTGDSCAILGDVVNSSIRFKSGDTAVTAAVLGSTGSFTLDRFYTKSQIGDSSNTAQVVTTQYLKEMVDYTARGSIAIATGATYTFSAGIWTLTDLNGVFKLSLYDGSTWRENISSWGGGTVISDGTNVRMKNTDTISRNLFYLKQGLQR